MGADKRLFKFRLRLIFVILIICPNLQAQNSIRIQLIDSKTKIGVPYAYIKVLGKNEIQTANQDGFFSIYAEKQDSIIISHIAYKTFRTTFKNIQKHSTIELIELSIDLNPIVVSPKTARIIIDRSIKSTYKTIKEHTFSRCYRLDRLSYGDTLIADAKAEFIFYIQDVLLPSYGCQVKGNLVNLKVKKISIPSGVEIPNFDIPALYAPYNRFIIGVSHKVEKDLYFSNQVVNDSIVIVNIKPRLGYYPKNYLLKSGRFIINNKNWRILQIDMIVTPEMMQMGYNSPAAKRFYYHYSTSYLFKNDGSLSNILLDNQYSYFENNPKKVWRHYSEIAFIPEPPSSKFDIKNFTLKKDSVLFDMKSKYDDHFEKNFNKWIPIEPNVLF